MQYFFGLPATAQSYAAQTETPPEQQGGGGTIEFADGSGGIDFADGSGPIEFNN